jgi:hypothetical protein
VTPPTTDKPAGTATPAQNARAALEAELRRQRILRGIVAGIVLFAVGAVVGSIVVVCYFSR